MLLCSPTSKAQAMPGNKPLAATLGNNTTPTTLRVISGEQDMPQTQPTILYILINIYAPHKLYVDQS